MGGNEKLWEISDEIQRVIMESVDPETGEISDEVSTHLDALEMDAQAKSMACAAYIKGLRAEASACDEVYKRAKRLKQQADRLEDYLSYHAEKCGMKGTRLADGYSEITWRRSTRVEVIDKRCVPLDLCGDPPPSLTLIKSAMKKAGVEELKTEAGFVFAKLDSDVRLKVK